MIEFGDLRVGDRVRMTASGPRNGVLGTITALHPTPIKGYTHDEVTVVWDDLDFPTIGLALLIAEVVA